MRLINSNAEYLDNLNQKVIECTLCPRLVDYRQEISRKKRRMYINQDYWGLPLPSYGDPGADILIIGLAPAAHGGNRTGRMFTGDKSGDWLFETLYKFGFANSPSSIHRDDGLILKQVYITATIRCAPPYNKPLQQERINCLPYLLSEIEALSSVRVVVALGRVAFDSYLAARREMGLCLPRPKPRFSHGATYNLPDGIFLIASYHPSQQNTQTRKLTRNMFEGVFSTVRHFVNANDKSDPSWPP